MMGMSIWPVGGNRAEPSVSPKYGRWRHRQKNKGEILLPTPGADGGCLADREAVLPSTAEQIHDFVAFQPFGLGLEQHGLELRTAGDAVGGERHGLGWWQVGQLVGSRPVLLDGQAVHELRRSPVRPTEEIVTKATASFQQRRHCAVAMSQYVLPSGFWVGSATFVGKPWCAIPSDWEGAQNRVGKRVQWYEYK